MLDDQVYEPSDLSYALLGVSHITKNIESKTLPGTKDHKQPVEINNRGI